MIGTSDYSIAVWAVQFLAAPFNHKIFLFTGLNAEKLPVFYPAYANFPIVKKALNVAYTLFFNYLRELNYEDEIIDDAIQDLHHAINCHCVFEDFRLNGAGWEEGNVHLVRMEKAAQRLLEKIDFPNIVEWVPDITQLLDISQILNSPELDELIDKLL